MELPPPVHAAKAVERFVFFSDAVFAFALTVQVITLKLPPQARKITAGELVDALHASVPSLICYALTFFIVAALWARHHRLFEKLRDYDTVLIVLNFILLFAISLFPFVIQMVTSTSDLRLPYTFYGGLVVSIGIILICISWHLQRKPGLLHETASSAAFRRELARLLLMTLTGGVIVVACSTLANDDVALALVGFAPIALVIRRYTRSTAP